MAVCVTGTKNGFTLHLCPLPQAGHAVLVLVYFILHLSMPSCNYNILFIIDKILLFRGILVFSRPIIIVYLSYIIAKHVGAFK